MYNRDDLNNQQEINMDYPHIVSHTTFLGFNLTLKTLSYNSKDIFNTGKVEEDLYEFSANSNSKDPEKITFLITRLRTKDGKKLGDKTSWIWDREFFRKRFGMEILSRVIYFLCKQC